MISWNPLKIKKKPKPQQNFYKLNFCFQSTRIPMYCTIHVHAVGCICSFLSRSWVKDIQTRGGNARHPHAPAQVRTPSEKFHHPDATELLRKFLRRGQSRWQEWIEVWEFFVNQHPDIFGIGIYIYIQLRYNMGILFRDQRKQVD